MKQFENPTTEKRRPIEETETSVSYLGVDLPKAENRETAPRKENEADYINDSFSLELQKKIAIAWLDGNPILVEGGTSLGKTRTVKKMCAELGYEVDYVNLNGATDVEDLMGRYVPNAQRRSEGDPEYIFADGKVTSGLRQSSGKIKVIILDEYNSASPNILIRLHEVLDALERGGEVVLSEDASEVLKVNKEKTKVIALMNPPGKGYLQREALDPAQLRRWVYQKEVTDLPDETFSHATDAIFGLAKRDEENIPENRYLPLNEGTLSPEDMKEIPGLKEIAEKYKEFHKAAKGLLANRTIAGDQPQPFSYDDRMEPKRVRDFVARFYRGDVNATFQEAIRYYYIGKILDKEDKAKLEELLRHVEYVPQTAESKRKGLDPDVQAPDGAPHVSLEKEGKITLLEAEKVMGDNFIGPKVVKEAFGITMKEIPPIPFSKEDLERAKSLGEELILYADQAPDGKPLTMQKMNEILKGKAPDGGKLLYDTEWYKNESFFTRDASSAKWRLTSKQPRAWSTSENYIGQTVGVISWLKDEIFKGKSLPKEYKEAIDEFEKRKKELEQLLDKDWKKAATELEKLKITKLIRETPQEVLYRLVASEKKQEQLGKKSEKSLGDIYTWTNIRSSSGYLVYVGYFGANGARVGNDGPSGAGSNLGVCVSRSV